MQTGADVLQTINDEFTSRVIAVLTVLPTFIVPFARDHDYRIASITALSTVRLNGVDLSRAVRPTGLVQGLVKLAVRPSGLVGPSVENPGFLGPSGS